MAQVRLDCFALNLLPFLQALQLFTQSGNFCFRRLSCRDLVLRLGFNGLARFNFTLRLGLGDSAR